MSEAPPPVQPPGNEGAFWRFVGFVLIASTALSWLAEPGHLNGLLLWAAAKGDGVAAFMILLIGLAPVLFIGGIVVRGLQLAREDAAVWAAAAEPEKPQATLEA